MLSIEQVELGRNASVVERLNVELNRAALGFHVVSSVHYGVDEDGLMRPSGEHVKLHEDAARQMVFIGDAIARSESDSGAANREAAFTIVRDSFSYLARQLESGVNDGQDRLFGQGYIRTQRELYKEMLQNRRSRAGFPPCEYHGTLYAANVASGVIFMNKLAAVIPPPIAERVSNGVELHDRASGDRLRVDGGTLLNIIGVPLAGSAAAAAKS